MAPLTADRSLLRWNIVSPTSLSVVSDAVRVRVPAKVNLHLGVGPLRADGYQMSPDYAGADVVLGSRWIPGGSVVNWPLDRKLISQAGNLYIKIALGMPLNDATGGYRVYRASALRALDLATVDSVGYCFQVDMAWRAVRGGLRVVEVPIEFVERERGNSKMDSSIVKESLVRVTRWALEHRFGQVQRALGRGPGQDVTSR